MSDQNKLVVPKAGIGDVAISSLRMMLGAFPGWDTAADILLNVVGTPLERRMEKFFQSIVDELERLGKVKQLTIADLQANDRFVDVAIQAVRLAAATADAERREYLRNAVVNAAVDETLTDVETMIFLDLMGRYSALHVKCLQAMQAEMKWSTSDPNRFEDFVVPGVESDEALCQIVPALNGNRTYAKLIFDRLLADGLIENELLSSRLSRSKKPLGFPGNVVVAQATELGKRFLAFIESPDAGKNPA